MELRALAAAGLVVAFGAAAPPAHAVELERPASEDVAPPGYTMTANEVTAAAARDDKVREERATHPSLRPTADGDRRPAGAGGRTPGSGPDAETDASPRTCTTSGGSSPELTTTRLSRSPATAATATAHQVLLPSLVI